MITFIDEHFIIPGTWSFRAKPAPDRKYIPAKRIWMLPDHPANRKFLLKNFDTRDFDPVSLSAAYKSNETRSDEWPTPDWPTHVKNHLTGETFEVLPHQLDALNKAWGLRNFAFFHGMGSGKTLTCLLWWDALFKAGLITEAWAVVPNSIIDNWGEQILAWTPWNRDSISVYGILSLSSGNLPKELVAKSHVSLVVAVDESQRIKNAQATRTKVMCQIGKNAGFRAVLTGTSITKGIEDLYSQFNFLDPMITGHKSFYTFRNRYCQMGGFEGKQIVGYKEIPELIELLAPYTDVVPDPVKLPPMAREDRHVNLSPEQKRLLSELKDQMETEMAGNKLTVDNALTYYTRGAQIIGGFFPVVRADGSKYAQRLPSIPKLDELVEIVDGTAHKVVVFCRFNAEVEMVIEALAKHRPARIQSKDPNLQDEVNRFQSDDSCRVIVTTYASGAIGFTLVEGKVLIKYSGTFNYEDEAQSEKRIHRIGQKDETMTIRLMAKCKLDSAMKRIAEGKESIASFMNDRLQNPRALSELLEF